jgi:ABC-type multidrug transport system ATPase subunit
MALAFLGRPELILLEFPFAGLDQAFTKRLFKEIEILKILGHGFIITSKSTDFLE